MTNDTLFATTVALFCALALILRYERLPACAILVILAVGLRSLRGVPND
jgi:hypothetical protein